MQHRRNGARTPFLAAALLLVGCQGGGGSPSGAETDTDPSADDGGGDGSGTGDPDADGDLIEYAVVYRTEVSDIDAASIMVPSPRNGWASVRISGHKALKFEP